MTSFELNITKVVKQMPCDYLKYIIRNTNQDVEAIRVEYAITSDFSHSTKIQHI